MNRENQNLMTRYTQGVLMAQLREAEKELRETAVQIGDAGDDSSGFHDSANFDFVHQLVDLKDALVRGLRSRLLDAQTIVPRTATDVVGIGNGIDFQFDEEEQQEAFVVLGVQDSNQKPGWISHESGLARAVMGRPAPSRVEYRPNDNQTVIRGTLVAIRPGNFE